MWNLKKEYQESVLSLTTPEVIEAARVLSKWAKENDIWTFSLFGIGPCQDEEIEAKEKQIKKLKYKIKKLKKEVKRK